MRIFWMSTVFLMFISCSERGDKLLKNTETKLKSTKNVSYYVDKLSVEGKSAGDTLFTTIYASFEESATDTILGYNFLTESSLIHPRFFIPIVSKDHYNGNELTWVLESEVRNEKRVTEFNEIESSVIEHKITGHLPLILNLLNSDGYELMAKKKVNLKGKDCIQFNYQSTDSTEYQIFLDEKESLPILLRIVLNQEHHYIKEYYYRNFLFYETPQLPISLDVSQDNTKETRPLKVGDTFPDWALETIKGVPYTFTDHKGKTRLIFFSAINCGPCRLQIPTTKKIYDRYSGQNTLDVIGIYLYDTKEKLNLYTQEKGIIYPIVYNSLTNVKERYELIQKMRFSTPTILLINRDNKVTWIRSGFNPNVDEYLSEVEIQINKLFH